MCGLCGWISLSDTHEKNHKLLERMNDKLVYRGPDASGSYIKGGVALLHKRLIIIDPENGDQPMHLDYKGEHYVLIYNGELYNTEDIRKDLISLGHTFIGHSDTEVLLHSYAEWDVKCLEKFNGIYAFAIWKEKSETLLLVRDRLGVKPLFYYAYNDGFLFSSEVKALLENPLVRPIVDQNGLKEIFLIGPGKINGSAVFKDIKEIMPGEYLLYRKGNIKKDYYWTLKAAPHGDNLEETIEKTKFLVSDSIIRQLISDVPLACFLSGGLDSSIITKVAADFYRKSGRRMVTYSVDYEDNDHFFIKNSYQPDTDNKYIDLMVKNTDSDHTDIVLDNINLAYALDEATEARELPGMADIDSSLLLFCREIKKKNKVCISGECADEIFGGYPWYHKEELLNRETFPWSYSIELRKKMARPGLLKGDLDEFVRTEYEKTVKATDYLDSDSKTERRIREMYRLNIEWFMQTLLIRSDRMSSYCGLEVRVPYCDHRLIEYAYNMPWNFKSLYGREKGILREAFKDILPYEIVNRKKSPYPKTFNPIFMDYVKKHVKLILEDSNNPVNSLLNQDFIEELLEGKNTFMEPWYGQLMRLPQVFAYILQLDYFLREFNVNIIEN